MPILAYHSVSDDWEHPLSVRPKDFRTQIDSIRDRVIPLDEYLGRFLDGTLTTRQIALTFDDAYADNFDTVVPLIRDMSTAATIFVPVDFIGKAADLGTGIARQIMSANMIREAAGSGISVGSHSKSHPNLRATPDHDLVDEIVGSKMALEDLSGTAVTTFCYPSGFYDDRCVETVALNYRAGVVTPRRPWGHQTRWTLRRVGIYRHDDLARFRLKLSRSGQMLRWLSLAARRRADGYGP